MLGWQKHWIYGVEEKSTQSANNHPISQDSKENQNYLELERSTHHYELTEMEKMLQWRMNERKDEHVCLDDMLHKSETLFYYKKKKILA
jgi:DUF438 domain-containing protein